VDGLDTTAHLSPVHDTVAADAIAASSTTVLGAPNCATAIPPRNAAMQLARSERMMSAVTVPRTLLIV